MDLTEIVISCIREELENQGEGYEKNNPEILSSTQLMGKYGILDSNALVSTIIYIEEKLDEDYDVSITIADERAMSREKSPFKTVGTLIEYIDILIKEQE